MTSKKKIKSKNQRINKSSISQKDFEYFKFNFSFIHKKYSLDALDKNGKVKFIERISDICSLPIYQIASEWSKTKGYEFLEVNNFKKKVSIPSDFGKCNHRANGIRDNKYMIFRLYPNNNPLPIRIIGKFCSPVFYVLYIDKNHDFY